MHEDTLNIFWSNNSKKRQRKQKTFLFFSLPDMFFFLLLFHLVLLIKPSETLSNKDDSKKKKKRWKCLAHLFHVGNHNKTFLEPSKAFSFSFCFSFLQVLPCRFSFRHLYVSIQNVFLFPKKKKKPKHLWKKFIPLNLLLFFSPLPPTTFSSLQLYIFSFLSTFFFCFLHLLQYYQNLLCLTHHPAISVFFFFLKEFEVKANTKETSPFPSRK